jgi:hypothetical protein
LEKDLVLAQSDDITFFEALTSFVKGTKLTFGSDFSQGFIKEDEYSKLLRRMLQYSYTQRLGILCNLQVGSIIIKNNKLYIDDIPFMREPNDKLNSPYAIFIKHSNKPVRYYNYYKNNYEGLIFKQQLSLADIMAEYRLTKEEAETYEKMLRDEIQGE